MIRILTAILFAFAASAQAQEGVATLDGTGAVLRAIDTLNGRVSDLTVTSGESTEFGNIVIALKECRYPEANPAADAYAHLVIQDTRQDQPSFSGWMLASSPALSSLEHARYDVWVISCITE